jgi:nuclear pore complex protein Nup98-Nup96
MKTVAGTASVSNFFITRKGFGSIHFTKDVDLTSIPSLTALREIVKIERGKAQLYSDESKKPGPGNGLNVPAKIELEKVKQPPDFDLEEFLDDLKTRPDQEFVSYESETWTYQVEHF